MKIRTYVGSDGHSVWFSDDLGKTWVRPNSHSGLYLETAIRGFASQPSNRRTLLAATSNGVQRWDEYDQKWTALKFPCPDVWAIAQSPRDPNLVFAGTLPAGLFRSHDAGASWHELPLPNLAPFSTVNMGPTRVTQILFDPIAPNVIWATIEIGGIYRSLDNGHTWTLHTAGLNSVDVHGICAIQDERGKRVMYATTNRGFHRSDDFGETWTFIALDSPWQYTRAIVARADGGKRLFLTNGDWPPGSTGRLLASDDHGRTWRGCNLPGELNSTMWCLATNAADPNLLFALTNLGQLFLSQDGGDVWTRIKREFGGIRSVHRRPINDDVPVLLQTRSSISLTPTPTTA